jgi:elongator complex protein 3
MPGLPGSSMQKDSSSLKKLFNNQDFQPDSIKFYPTQVVYNSELYEWYKKGQYKPYEVKNLFSLTRKFKKEIIPKWVRIHRLVRDLTKNDVAATTFPSNFRQKILAELEKEKIKCPCIRCREIKGKKIKGRIKININHYSASGGKEYFIEGVDNNNSLIGFLRLRIPEYFLTKQSFFIKELNDCVIIRELHVYGQQVPVGGKGATQHIGLGTKLLIEAEKIADKCKAKKIAVISGVGVREYYKKFGYEKKGEYMIKVLKV